MKVSSHSTGFPKYLFAVSIFLLTLSIAWASNAIASVSIDGGRTYYPQVAMEINGGNPETTNSQVTLALAALGSLLSSDGNQDGVVDAADYTIWRDQFGRVSYGLAGDYNSDGVVDGADYTVWRANFGKTSTVTDMRFSTDGVNFGAWIPYQSSYDWNFSSGEGIKTIYVQVRDDNQSPNVLHESNIASDTIFLTNTPLNPFLDVTSTNAVSTLTNPWIADFNTDGRPDALDQDEILINLGLGVFQHNNTTGVTGTHKNFGDFNNDGWMDLLDTHQTSCIYVNSADRHDNNQTNSFSSSFELFGTCFGPWLADLDGDGHLDMFGGGNSGFVSSRDQAYFIYDQSPSSSDYSVTRMFPAPEYNDWAISLHSAVIRDFDRDGDQDVYYNVFLVEGGPYRRMYRHYIFRNDGNRQFTRTAQVGDSYTPPFNTSPTTFNSTTDTGDFNNDGNWDMIIDNHVYFGNGDLTFTKGPFIQIAQDTAYPRVQDHYADVNNDGFIDILTYDEAPQDVTGVIETFLGDGTGNFILADTFTFPISVPGPRLFSIVDFDGDGELDIYAAGKIFKNQNTQKHSVTIRLTGTVSNRDAIGAEVKVKTGSKTQMRAIDGSLESDRLAHFGVGSANTIDQITIKWPSGLVSTYFNVPVNSSGILNYTEPSSGTSASVSKSAVQESAVSRTLPKAKVNLPDADAPTTLVRIHLNSSRQNQNEKVFQTERSKRSSNDDRGHQSDQSKTAANNKKMSGAFYIR